MPNWVVPPATLTKVIIRFSEKIHRSSSVPTFPMLLLAWLSLLSLRWLVLSIVSIFLNLPLLVFARSPDLTNIFNFTVQGARFAAIANTNGYRVEVITTKNMIKFMCTLLRAFKANTGKIPMRIFYFRDGVSEGQYQHIIEQELHDMREACKVLQSDYNPKITVTICSKRHHTRFFPIDKIAQDRNGNCVPGTIVERDVTHPTEYDFCKNFPRYAIYFTVITNAPRFGCSQRHSGYCPSCALPCHSR